MDAVAQQAIEDAVQKKLAEIRGRTDLTLKPMKHLKTTFTDFDGQEKPLRVRYYQVQGILHLAAMRRFLLGDDTGLGKCLTGDALLLTREGIRPLVSLAPKPLDQLVPGTFYDLEESVDIWTGRRWAPVKRFYYDGVKPTRRIRTRSGFEVEGSLRHPLLTRRSRGEDWVRTPELSEGDYLCVNREGAWSGDSEVEIPFSFDLASNAKVYNTPRCLTPDLARLLGYIVAEGHSPDQYTQTVTQWDVEAHADIRGLFKAVFGWEGNTGSRKKNISIEVTSVQIWAFLRECGIRDALSAGKHVPDVVLRAGETCAKEYLRGYFEGEGHAITGSGIEVTSASKHLLQETQILLLRFGVVGVLTPKKVKGYEHNSYWRLTIFGDSARRFCTDIGFVTRRKQEALVGILDKTSNPNNDVVPFTKPLVEALRKEIHARTDKGISTRWGSAFYNTLGHIRQERRNPTYVFLQKLVEVARAVGVPEEHPALVRVCDVISAHYFYDPIDEIRESTAPVMDIEVDDPTHAFTANGLINHNTLETIGALCALWEKNPDLKAVILTTKSAAKQWAREFGKFTTGVKVVASTGSPAERTQARALFEKSTGPTVFISGYRSFVQDFSFVQNWKGFVFVTDEATVYKNPKTQVHQVCRHMSDQADRVWALTATLIKNNLMEGHGIFSVVKPGLFGTQNAFILYYCIVRMQKIPKSKRQIPIVVGYTNEKIKEFRDTIAPLFLGRPKHEVATELPALVQQNIEVEMTPEQEDKYDETLSGLLMLGADVKETTKLTQVTYCQEVCDHLGLLDAPGDSGKLDTLVDLLTQGDFADEKMIVFSRFRKMIDILMPVFATNKLKAVRVTGAEDETERDAAMRAFQDPNGDTRICCITMAGSESINLQAAKAIIFFDTPWSAGDYLQILGRMIRIGSEHDRCYAVHLVGKLKRHKQSIDQRIMVVQAKKMNLIEAVIGKRIKGVDDNTVISVENDISDLFEGLKADAKATTA